MAFSVKQFAAILSDMATWIVANQNKITDLNEGSVIRSFCEAVAQQCEQIYIRGRVGFTENLTDVPPVAFDFIREAGQKAAGIVIFSRAGSSGDVTIPNGTLLSTPAGIQFITTAESLIANGNTDSANVTIQAYEVGTGGNVPASTITTIVTPIPGVDTVDNAASTTGGLNTETDGEFLRRFQEFIEGLGKANKAGLVTGAKEVTGIRSASVVEHFPPVSSYNATLYIDDGAGEASAALIAAVATRVVGDGTSANRGYKAGGINLRVLAPTKVVITVTVEVATDGSLSDGVVEAAIKSDVQDYINNLLIGDDCIKNKIIEVIIGVASITDLTLSAPASNTSISDSQIARTSSTDITVTFA